jgi:dGTPase
MPRCREALEEVLAGAAVACVTWRRTRPGRTSRGRRCRSPRPGPHRVPARPRPHRPFHRVPPARIQDPGLREPRRRPLPHPPHPQPRSRADRPLRRPQSGLDEDLVRGNRARPRSGAHAVRPRRAGCLERLHEAHGGFEHNLQSCAWSTMLEQRYGAFDGLNLTFETREGILKHCSVATPQPRRRRRAVPPAPAAGARGAARESRRRARLQQPRRGRRAALRAARLEGQSTEPLFRATCDEVLEGSSPASGSPAGPRDRPAHDRHFSSRPDPRKHRSGLRVRRRTPSRTCARPPAHRFSGACRRNSNLKRFLRERLYRHYRVARMSSKARRIVQELFAAFLADPVCCRPSSRRARCGGQVRAIADYIAGMTDRYAILEHRRLFAIEESLTRAPRNLAPASAFG